MPPSPGLSAVRSFEAQSRLVSLIYDAAASPDQWPRFMEELAHKLELQAVTLVICGADASGPISPLPMAYGIDDSAMTAYESYYVSIDPHQAPSATSASGVVGQGENLISDDDFVRTEFFNDFYAPAGLRRNFATVVHNAGSQASVMVCHRGPDQGAVSDADLSALRILSPHLMRARALAEQIGTMRSQQRMSGEVLDRLPVGLVFIDAAGAVLRVNMRGEEMLMAEDGLRVRKGLIGACDPRETTGLKSLIAAASTPPTERAKRTPLSLRISRPSGRRDLDVMACPAVGEANFWREPGASAFLVVSDGQVNLEGTALRLQDLYALTAVESNLAVSIANGCTLRQVAEERGVSVETVRWQLKQVFAKTGTSRQPDLIRLVLLGPQLAQS